MLEWLMLYQGGARVREGVPVRFIARILDLLDEAVTERSQRLTVDEALALVEVLIQDRSRVLVCKAVGEWVAGLLLE